MSLIDGHAGCTVCDVYAEACKHQRSVRTPLFGFSSVSMHLWLQVSNQDAALVAIHDSARPLVKADDVRKCLEDALEVRLATALDSPLTGLLLCCRMRCPKQCTTGSRMLGWDRCPCDDISLPEELVQLAFSVRAEADHVQSV